MLPHSTLWDLLLSEPPAELSGTRGVLLCRELTWWHGKW